MRYKEESNFMATEGKKVVINLHAAEKIRNRYYTGYVLEKHFENRFYYKLIEGIKHFNNFAC